MKKTKIMMLLGLLLLAFMVSGMSCPPPVVETSSGRILVLGWFSWPVIYLSDGSNNFADTYNPVTGTTVSDATVTVSNETTGVSTLAAWNAAAGCYVSSENLPHSAGQQVSLRVETSAETITGDPTATPDPLYSNLSPANGASVTLPFTVSWDVTQGTYEATRSWVWISGPTTSEADNYQVVVPISQKSVQITSADISSTGSYSLGVFGVNVMNLNGAKSGSVVYVGGGTAVSSMNVTIEAQ